MCSVLAVCRDEAAFRSVLAIDGLNAGELVVASDDLRVHACAKECADLKVVYFCQMEPFFNVASHVLRILDAINRWLHVQGDGRYLPAELLYWVQHIEGGDTTQRIQDAILEARSCLALLNKLDPSRLIIGAARKPYWEDEVLVACAALKHIPVHRIITIRPTRIAADLWQRLRPLAKEVYSSVSTLVSLYRRKKSGFGSRAFGKYVAIQLCSSAAKHLNHTVPLLEAFKHEGLDAVAVTSGVGLTAQTLRKQGHKVAELEAWVPPGVLILSWCAAFKGVWRAKANMSSFLLAGEGGEYAPLIRSALLPWVRGFFLSGVPYRIRLREACRVFFEHNPPIAARLWTRIQEQGSIAYQALEMNGVRPLLFWQPGWPYQLHWPYLRNEVPADLIFCMSSAHTERLLATGESASQFELSGIQWLHRVKEFSRENTPHQSRTSLGISPQAKLVVFCDAQMVLGGYCSAAEQSLLVNTVVQFAERHKDVCVLIKPHTGHKPGQLEEIFRGRGGERIIWIPGKALPYDGLNASHVVLTKFSTLVAEAMVLGVPSICVLLDKDMRWAIYEDAVDYALSVAELNNKLEDLRDAELYSSWVNILRKHQIDYMGRHLPEPEMECNTFIATKVKAALIAGSG